MPRKGSDIASPRRLWRVGELAERTGLTVRTLHHYDAIGLLSPGGRTGSAHGSGHRLYTAADVARLQQIVSLKQLGFGLDEIRAYLARDDYDPRQVVRMHLARVRGRAEELKRLEDRLSALADALEKAEAVSADEFLTTTEEMTMIEKYYTPEQLEQLDQRRRQVGEDRMLSVQLDWADLHTAVATAMESGMEPSALQAQELARRWFGLVSEFTGGDPAIFNSLKRMYENEDTVRGMDVAAMRPSREWIGKAAAAAGIETPRP